MHSIIKRFFSRDQRALPNISIMGLDGAGKTTLLYKLAISKITDIIPTIGVWIQTANICVPDLVPSSAIVDGGKNEERQPLCFAARVADAGGCARSYPLVRHFMMKEGEVSAFVWVVDAASSSEGLLDMSLEELGVLLQEDFAVEIPVLVLANKIDLFPGANRKVPDDHEFRAKFCQLLKGRRFAIFETNITAGYRPESGLAEAFAWLGDAITAASTSFSSPTETRKKENQVTTAEEIISNMRSPEILSAKLEDWLARADRDPITSGEELLRRFYAFDLPSWDHYIHLRLAFVLLVKYGRREGKDKIFAGFKEYIEHNGKGVHGGKSFHLTMTYFWVQMVHLGIARGTGNTVNVDGQAAARDSHSLCPVKATGEDQDPGTSVGDFARFLMLNPFLVDGLLWQDYYSKEVLMSQEAKEGFVLPDIKKLPDVL
ncbi:ADP-ribosylation factor family-domain-containing protein, partial [Rhypophila decipiens]